MNSDFAVMDASLGRMREGLRVVEETARYILRDKELFEEIKAVRHEVRRFEVVFGGAHLLTGRKGDDFGRACVVESEYQRSSIWDILRANFNRINEAARVLEEFSKISHAPHAEKIEEMRYDIYSLEKKILEKIPHYWLRLYFEHGVVYALSDSVEELCWLIRHGAKVVQLRDKAGNRSVIYNKAKHLCDYVKGITRSGENYGPVLVFVNDYVEVARSLPLAGVHIGQEDGAVASARRLIGSAKVIGRSSHSISQLREAVKQGADYVSVGPVFPTETKPEYQPVGLDTIRQVVGEAQIPWVAIGGISRDNVEELRMMGAKNVAVVRAAREFFGA